MTEPVARTNLLDFDTSSMADYFKTLEEKPFRAQQLIKWIHQHGVDDFDAMTNISKSLRAKLSQLAEIRAPEIKTEQRAEDGTIKWLLKLADGNAVETVFIPEKDRHTLCVSSQVGCALDCTFCSTARQGFNRNLSVAEIIGQVWVAERRISALGLADKTAAGERALSNVVLMGMGEPLLNYQNTLSAMRLMLDDNAYGLSKRRVTLSTSGVVPALDRLSNDLDVSLAVSLHAPNDELRDKLVPLNRKYPIAELMAACQRYVADKALRTRITMEYVMLDGVNDSPSHARQLVSLLKDVPSKVNLIPFNPFPETYYQRSPQSKIDRFRDILMSQGMNTVTRKTRGDDIDAACGQLAGSVQDKSRRVEHFARIEQPLS